MPENDEDSFQSEGRSKIEATIKEWNELFPEIISPGFEKTKMPNEVSSIDENNMMSKIRSLLITTYEVLFDTVKSNSASMRQQKHVNQKLLSEICSTISNHEELLEKLLKTHVNQHEFNKNLLESVKSLRIHQNEQNTNICHIMTRMNERDDVIKHCGERLDKLEKQSQKIKRRVRFSSVVEYEEEKFLTNWSDLPDSWKLMCIKQMDFQERLRLRSTARSERRLVDSQRFVFDEINLFYRDSFIATWKNSKCTKYQLLPRTGFLRTPDEVQRIQSLTSLLVYILKNCNICNLSVEELPGDNLSVLEELDYLVEDKSIKVRNFRSEMFYQTTKLILKKSWINLDNVSIEQHNLIGKELIAIPSITTAKHLWFTNGPGWRRLLPLVENFMFRNGEVGSKLTVQCLDKILYDKVIASYCCRAVARRGNSEFEIYSNKINKNILVKYKDGLMEVTVIHSEF